MWLSPTTKYNITHEFRVQWSYYSDIIHYDNLDTLVWQANKPDNLVLMHLQFKEKNVHSNVIASSPWEEGLNPPGVRHSEMLSEFLKLNKNPLGVTSKKTIAATTWIDSCHSRRQPACYSEKVLLRGMLRWGFDGRFCWLPDTSCWWMGGPHLVWLVPHGQAMVLCLANKGYCCKLTE